MQPAFIEKHAMRCIDHYHDAIAKHPYFCDLLAPVQLQEASADELADYKENIAISLRDIRDQVKLDSSKGELSWGTLLLCEMWEVDDAIANGDTAAAVKKLYDCAAVILRTVDALEGRQSLGKPETIRDKYVQLKKEGKTE